MPISYKTNLERLVIKIDKHGPLPHKKACEIHPEIAKTRCWEFKGFHDSDGYGRFRLFGKDTSAHRAYWILKHGKIPKTKERKDRIDVRHKCDNPGCLRLLHLFLGTAKQDAEDKVAKNRNIKGFAHGLKVTGHLNGNFGNFKLKEKDIARLYKLHISGVYTFKDLSILYNVGVRTIKKAILRYNTK